MTPEAELLKCKTQRTTSAPPQSQEPLLSTSTVLLGRPRSLSTVTPHPVGAPQEPLHCNSPSVTTQAPQQHCFPSTSVTTRAPQQPCFPSRPSSWGSWWSTTMGGCPDKASLSMAWKQHSHAPLIDYCIGICLDVKLIHITRIAFMSGSVRVTSWGQKYTTEPKVTFLFTGSESHYAWLTKHFSPI